MRAAGGWRDREGELSASNASIFPKANGSEETPAILAMVGLAPDRFRHRLQTL
jgi:hypothetical protein